jgi:hypothetical protein
MECHHGTYCPYLNGGDIWHLIGERDHLNQRIDEMEKVMALALGRDGKVASRKSESLGKKRRHWVIN